MSQFDGDRGPGETSATVTLTEGLYSFEFIGWEQGGQFVNELAWIKPGEVEFSLLGDRNSPVFFTTQGDVPVSLPSVLSLLLIGLIALGYTRQINQS